MTGARLIVLSGLSGAGKTTALHALEDIGFFAVDNIPPSLWAPLARRAEAVGEARVAVSVDVRTSAFLGELETGLEALKESGFEPTVLFLTASDHTLVKRYSLTRRTHPIGEGTLSRDIASERVSLEGVRSRAQRVMDTTELSAKELAHQIRRTFAQERSFRLRLVSFGYKRGAPIDADLVLDVRALPNPYYEEALRRLSGTEAEVQAHVFTPGGLELYTQLRNLVRTLAALARDGERTSYTVALGCTGGQHRSVAVVERLVRDLAQHFDAEGEHRDLANALAEHQA
ncbi:MAG: RNase adapter RapZ [Trueperaceae bacterium]